jgi:Ca2+-binding EF-hand superfamily protein
MGCSLSSITTNKKKTNRTFVDTSQQLSEEQIEQLLKTRFSRSEIVNWHQAFIEKCGVSGDVSSYLTARINKPLFTDYFNQLHPNGDVTRLTESFFRTYDLNNDGAIDFMEFMHAISIIRRGDLTEKLSLIFSLLDSNQEGYIDRLKLVEMMEALYNIKGIDYKDSYNILLRKVDNLLTRLDQDKEGGRIFRYKFIESCMNDPALRDLINVYK